MKKLYSLIALMGLSLGAAATSPLVATEKSPYATKTDKQVTQIETLNVAGPNKSLEKVETEFVATKAQLFYYDNFYKDGNACYQVVITNCEDGFNDGGTLPAGPAQLFCAFLCGPKSEDKDNPIIPAGKYEFAEDPGLYTFGSKYGHYVDAFMYEGSLSGWQLTLCGGTVEIAETNGIYTVNVSVKAYDEDENGDETFFNCKASYEGEIKEPGPIPALPGEVYNMDVPTLSGMYDEAQGQFTLNFFGTPIDENSFIVGSGDYINTILICKSEGDLLEDFQGTYTCVPYYEFDKYENYKFIGGIYYEIFTGLFIPFGTHVAQYNDSGSIKTCGLATGGTITIKANGDHKQGNFTFEFDLVSNSGNKMVGSWSGNIFNYISGIGTAGIDEVENTVNIQGAIGRIIAPEGAKVYNISGNETGCENLQPGLYIVRYNGNATKVIVK